MISKIKALKFFKNICNFYGTLGIHVKVCGHWPIQELRRGVFFSTTKALSTTFKSLFLMMMTIASASAVVMVFRVSARFTLPK